MTLEVNYSEKATTAEIRSRFDKDVERFSNLDTGQQTTIDAPLTMELCTEAAKYCNPEAKKLLDIGCGAGNYTLKMLSKIKNLNCTLNDLSLPMLQRAEKRVKSETSGQVSIIQEDMRNLSLPENHFDIILAAAVFHHLREDRDWENVFSNMYKILKPGGSIWISDLISHNTTPVTSMFKQSYAEYIEKLGGKEYRVKVMAYVDYEDSPRSLTYQLNLLKEVGFQEVEVLHKNSSFAAFGAIK